MFPVHSLPIGPDLAYTHTHTSMDTQTCTHSRAAACMQAHSRKVHAGVQPYIHIHILRMHTHTHDNLTCSLTHTHTHTHTHIYTHTLQPDLQPNIHTFVQNKRRRAASLRPHDARMWCALGQCYVSEQVRAVCVCFCVRAGACSVRVFLCESRCVQSSCVYV
jgi:hypothetical protein